MGRFISDTTHLKDDMIADILSLFAGTVTYDSTVKYTKYESPEYAVMPSAFLIFANECGVNSGYWLLKRCLRHAFDSKSPSILTSKVKLFRHKEDG